MLQLIDHVCTDTTLLLKNIQPADRIRRCIRLLEIQKLRFEQIGFSLHDPGGDDLLLIISSGEGMDITLDMVTAQAVDIYGQFFCGCLLLPFPEVCIDHRKGPGAVAHDMIAAIIGIMVDTVTGCLHLFLR